MRINFSAIVSRLCAAGVTLLGFGCSTDGPDYDDCGCGDGFQLMYGTPTGSWKVHGSVKTQKGDNIDDSTIRITRPDTDSGSYSMYTTPTDAKGTYSVAGCGSAKELKVVCIPADPTLDADSIVIPLKYKKKGDSYSLGHADATVNFKLKSKSGK